MKELVISINKAEIRIDESALIKFFIKPLFVLFMYFGVYSRTSGFLGFTGGQLTVLLSFSLFFLAAFHMVFIKRDLRVSNYCFFIILFFVLSAVMPIFSAFFFGAGTGTIIRYSFEIGINLFMFFAMYYFIREKIISPKFFLYTIAILGLIASLSYLSVMFSNIIVYRLRGLGGLNTLGNSFALGVLTWSLIIYAHSQREQQNKIKKYVGYISIVMLFLALLFTGTRSALIALAVGLFFLQVLGMKSKQFTKYILYTFLGIAAAIVIVALNFDLSYLWGRFTWDSVTRMAGMRFTIYANSITDLTLLDFLFGRPDFYIFSNEADDFINPHNLFLSTIRYNGLILFIMLIFIFVIFFYKYFTLYRIHQYQSEYRLIESSTLVLFVMVVIYTMFSGGRTTRSFNFFITLGYAVGYFELFKNLRSYEDYKKLIF